MFYVAGLRKGAEGHVDVGSEAQQLHQESKEEKRQRQEDKHRAITTRYA